MKKPEHIYRWRTSWKQRRLNSRPTEDEALRHIWGGFLDDLLLPIPKPSVLGEVLLIFLLQHVAGIDVYNANDILMGANDFDRRQAYIRVAEKLDRKGRLSYYNQERRQYQKTNKPLLIAELLNEQLSCVVTPQDVKKAQHYRKAQTKRPA